MTQRYALAVMARTPRAYKTKTRLATALGHAGAMRAHIQLVEDTLSRLTQMPNIDTSLWVTEIDAQARQWANTFQVALNNLQQSEPFVVRPKCSDLDMIPVLPAARVPGPCHL